MLVEVLRAAADLALAAPTTPDRALRTLHAVTETMQLAPTPGPVITDAPNPGPVAPNGLDTVGGMFLSWLKYILLVCGVGGLFACGIMMTVGRRNRSAMAADGAAGIPWVLAGLTCGAIGATVVGVVLL